MIGLQNDRNGKELSRLKFSEPKGNDFLKLNLEWMGRTQMKSPRRNYCSWLALTCHQRHDAGMGWHSPEAGITTGLILQKEFCICFEEFSDLQLLAVYNFNGRNCFKIKRLKYYWWNICLSHALLQRLAESYAFYISCDISGFWNLSLEICDTILHCQLSLGTHPPLWLAET